MTDKLTTEKNLKKQISALKKQVAELKDRQKKYDSGRQLLISANRRMQESAQKAMLDLEKSNESLRVQYAQLMRLIEKTPNANIIVDKNGITRYANPAAEALFCRKKEKFVGQSFGLPVLAGEMTEIEIPSKDGKPRAVEMRAVEIEWEGKLAILVLLHDITAIKQAEKLKSEIDEQRHIYKLKDEFISTVSHELRTPLAITKEGVGLILDKICGPINEKQESMLLKAKDNIARLTDIINSMVDISKLKSGKIELKKVLIDLSGLVKDICGKWRLECEKKRQNLQVSLPEPPVNIYLDPDIFGKILGNLILNAIRYTPEGGRIDVELNDRKDEVEISVSDTGIGIAKEDFDKIFGRFQQFGRVDGPGAKGNGLGLAIVKEFVEMHQGNVRFESEVNKGSKFTVIFPKIGGKNSV